MGTVTEWPFETTEGGEIVKDGLKTYRYKEVVVTIAEEREGWYGWIFEEDVERANGYKPIWHPKGNWNDADKRFDDYDGAKFPVGHRIGATLTMREYKAKDGEIKTAYDVVRIRPVTDNTPTTATTAPAVDVGVVERAKPQSSREEGIAKGRAANSLTEILSALLIVEAKWAYSDISIEQQNYSKQQDDSPLKKFYANTEWDNLEEVVQEWHETYVDSKAGKTPFMRIDTSEVFPENEEEGQWE